MVQTGRAKCFCVSKTDPGVSTGGLPHSPHLELLTTTPKLSPIFRWKPICRRGAQPSGDSTRCRVKPCLYLNPYWFLRAVWPWVRYLPLLSPSFLIGKSERWTPSSQGCWKDCKIIYARGLEQCLFHSRCSVMETARIMPMPSSVSVGSLSFPVLSEVKQVP